MKRAGQGSSRRRFMKQAVLGAGAATVGAGTSVLASAAEEDVDPITVPAEFETAKHASLPEVDFPMTGAQVFARACKAEGVAALFCCPGNYSVVHAMSDTGIPTYGGRHEGAMCHAADAFTRVTGEIVATSGTEGPGFTDMICGIAAANSARSPILVLASNKTIFAEDTERGIQDAYQQPTTEGMRKYGKRMITPARIHEYAGYAFRQLRSGVPKPVHLDFPAEIANARFRDASEIEYFFDKTKVPHRDPAAPRPPGHRPGRRDARRGRAPDHRLEQRRVPRPGVEGVAPARRAGAHSGRRVGSHQGAVPRRPRAVRGRRAAGPGRRRSRPSCRPVLHAHAGRVRVRAGRPLHPHRPLRRGHRPQPPDRPRHRQRRAGRPRGSRRRCPAHAPRRVGGGGGGGPGRVRGPERGVLPDRERLRRRGASRRHREGAGRLRSAGRAAAGPDHHRAGGLRHRPLYAAGTCGASAPGRS